MSCPKSVIQNYADKNLSGNRYVTYFEAFPEKAFASHFLYIFYSSDDLVEFLSDRCQGIDFTEVEDDEGEQTKTVSVENSFRRGTVNRQQLDRFLQTLCSRVITLIEKRCSDGDESYPTTIRISIVYVESKTRKKRSKQACFDGKSILSQSHLLIRNRTKY